MSTVVEQTIKELQEHAENIKQVEKQVYETMSVNDGHWQGDLGVQFLGTKFDTSNFNEVKVPEKLVEGSNVGSRHILSKDIKVAKAWRANVNPLVLYVLHAPNGLRVDHPTHGDVECREPGFYAIRAQRAFAEELRRQKD